MTASSEIRSVATVALALARRLIAAAEAEADARGVRMGIAVVDPAGEPVAVSRMDGASPVALKLAVDKAFTAAAFNAPTDGWGEVTAPGGADWGLTSALGGRVLLLPGGLPLRVGGVLVGAIGVSGAAPAVDLACATAAVQAVDLPTLVSNSPDN